jgi:CheY-like chemotaxis protein
MDGYTVTRRIRTDEHYQNLPIVALTAHAIAGEKERCLAAGMNGYLTKPLQREAIISILQHKLPRETVIFS